MVAFLADVFVNCIGARGFFGIYQALGERSNIDP